MSIIKFLIQIEILLKILTQISEFEDININLKNSQNIELNFSVLSPIYKDTIKIPDSKLTFFQIEAGSSGNYTVDGISITVNEEGTVTPFNQTKYYYENGIISEIPLEGVEPIFIDKSYTTGKSTVICVVGNNTFNITINVIDYAKEYAEVFLDNYIDINIKNITNSSDQLIQISNFTSKYPYNPYYNNYISFIIFKKGNNLGALDTIIYMAKKVGIKSHYRFSKNDPDYSSKNNLSILSVINDKFYVTKIIYDDEKENSYNIYEIQEGYSYVISNNNNNIQIYQYDGNNEEIIIPDKINDKKVIELKEKCFYNGLIYNDLKIKSITIPENIEKLGNYTFYGLRYLKEIFFPKTLNSIGSHLFENNENLEKIIVDENNSEFSSFENILYNKNKTKLIFCPQGKNGNFSGIEPLEIIEEYSFYGSKIENISIPKSVKYINKNAFSISSVKEVYFEGDPPIFGENIFYSLNLTVFYPVNNDKWNSSIQQKYGAKEINYRSFGELEKESNYIIWILIPVGIIVIFGSVGFIIFRKKSDKLSSNIDTLGREGLMNDRNDIAL